MVRSKKDENIEYFVLIAPSTPRFFLALQRSVELIQLLTLCTRQKIWCINLMTLVQKY